MTPTGWRFDRSNVPERLREANDLLERLLAIHGATERTRYAARLVCEEIVLNAFEHGGAGTVTLEVDPSDDPNRLCFEDDGAPFDPLGRTTARESSAPEAVEMRGRGLILVRRFTRAMEHRLVDGRNRLTVLLVD